MVTIDSAHNATFKKYQSLTTAKGLKKEGLFLLSGEQLVREYLKAPSLELVAELIHPKLKPVTTAAAIQLALPLFNDIDAVGTGFNILVLRQPPIEKMDAAELRAQKPKGIELVVPTGDPGNVGALIRSAEAFGVTRVILAEEAANPYLPKAVKASAGSILRVRLARGPALKEFPENCVALDASGQSVHNYAWPRNMRLVVGEEGRGLGAARFKHTLSIPTQGVESLNAVVAASVALAFCRHANDTKEK